MRMFRQIQVRKIIFALICGICIFVYDYLIALPFLMETYQERALNVFDEAYWWASALLPVVVVSLVMSTCTNYSVKDWKYFLIIACVQFFMLPILYWYVTELDFVKQSDLTWIVLAGNVFIRALAQIVADIMILALLERLTGQEGTE